MPNFKERTMPKPVKSITNLRELIDELEHSIAQIKELLESAKELSEHIKITHEHFIELNRMSALAGHLQNDLSMLLYDNLVNSLSSQSVTICRQLN